MTKKSPILPGLLLCLVASNRAAADVWDVGTSNDNQATATQNELVNGSDQIHDLAAQTGVADLDWYRLGQKAYSSYEIVVDATSAAVGPGLQLDRVGSDGSTVLQSSSAVSGLLFSRSVRWENATASAKENEYIRVKSNGCTTACTSNDVYRIRAYDTTYAVARFNNTGTQATVLLIQNPTTAAVAGNIYFWDGAGTLLAISPLSLPARGLQGLSTSTVPTLAGGGDTLSGKSGSVTVSNNARYGALSGKAVSLESSTGFSFDTLMVAIPH
jgi:hypothetical protein